MTHEQYIEAIRALARDYLRNPDERAKVDAIKLVYGAGETGLRGITYYSKWSKGNDKVPFVEICAFGQSSWVQVAGTTIHELGHVLAGWGAAHGPDWKAACERLGLRKIKAAGTRYMLANFDPALRARIAALPRPIEGEPVSGITLPFNGLGMGPTMKPCGAGVGTRGGKSRGKGSGSRLRLWACECDPPVKVRAATDHLRAHCDCCSGAFTRA